MVELALSRERNRLGVYGMDITHSGRIMLTKLPLVIALGLFMMACQGRGTGSSEDSSLAQSRPDSPATATPSASTPVGGAPTTGTSQPVSSTSTGTAGITPSEPGTIPAKPTPAVTSDKAIATMRQNLQRLETASATELSTKMTEHQKMLGDLLTTMRVEVQATTSPTKNAWLAAADSVEGDLDKLALADGEALRTAFRDHKTRVLRLLDGYRALMPAKAA